ncbi:hypothetical protein AB0R11_12375, partial [Streptomyces fradiae]
MLRPRRGTTAASPSEGRRAPGGAPGPAAGPLSEAHGGWFNEPRRIESIKAHAALGGRLLHGCQSV